MSHLGDPSWHSRAGCSRSLWERICLSSPNRQLSPPHLSAASKCRILGGRSSRRKRSAFPHRPLVELSMWSSARVGMSSSRHCAWSRGRCRAPRCFFPQPPKSTQHPSRSPFSRGGIAEGAEVVLPDYDQSDRDRRIESVSLSHFRGVPKELQVDFRRGDRCVSGLILGDNGSGKSSVVDAIEFGLQARIGRSVVFDGALSPSGASLATTETPRHPDLRCDRDYFSRTMLSR